MRLVAISIRLIVKIDEGARIGHGGTVFDDPALYSAEAKMKYDEIIEQARAYRLLIAGSGGTRIKRLCSLLGRFSARLAWRRRHTKVRTGGQHGDTMGSGYGLRVIRQSLRHP